MARCSFHSTSSVDDRHGTKRDLSQALVALDDRMAAALDGFNALCEQAPSHVRLEGDDAGRRRLDADEQRPPALMPDVRPIATRLASYPQLDLGAFGGGNVAVGVRQGVDEDVENGVEQPPIARSRH